MAGASQAALVITSISVSRSVLSDSLQPHELYSIRLLCPWDSPGKNTGVGCSREQTQGSNPGLPHCRQILYYLNHWGNSASAGGIRDVGLITGPEGAPGGVHGNPLQYSYLENSMDRRAWQVLQSIVSQRVRTEGLSKHTHMPIYDRVCLQSTWDNHIVNHPYSNIK